MTAAIEIAMLVALIGVTYAIAAAYVGGRVYGREGDGTVATLAAVFWPTILAGLLVYHVAVRPLRWVARKGIGSRMPPARVVETDFEQRG